MTLLWQPWLLHGQFCVGTCQNCDHGGVKQILSLNWSSRCSSGFDSFIRLTSQIVSFEVIWCVDSWHLHDIVDYVFLCDFCLTLIYRLSAKRICLNWHYLNRNIIQWNYNFWPIINKRYFIKKCTQFIAVQRSLRKYFVKKITRGSRISSSLEARGNKDNLTLKICVLLHCVPDADWSRIFKPNYSLKLITQSPLVTPPEKHFDFDWI